MNSFTDGINKTTHFNFQEQLHDLPLLKLLGGEGVLVDVDEQFVEVLRVLGLHEGQLLRALGLRVEQARRRRRGPPHFLRLHEKADWGTR